MNYFEKLMSSRDEALKSVTVFKSTMDERLSWDGFEWLKGSYGHARFFESSKKVVWDVHLPMLENCHVQFAADDVKDAEEKCCVIFGLLIALVEIECKVPVFNPMDLFLKHGYVEVQNERREIAQVG